MGPQNRITKRCEGAKYPSEFNRLTCKSPGQVLGLACLALVGALGCGERDIRVTERLPAPISPDRGRVQVREGNLLTDKGTRLRGVTFGVDANPAFPFDQALFDELAQQSGLNAFHVYLENPAFEAGAHVAQADLLVELTSKAGMYLVLGIGGGSLGGSFELESVLAFWSFYAERYAERTHVLYEIQNIPQRLCDEPYAADALQMERQAYALIRAAAPSTHVALFSFISAPSTAALEQNLDALGPDIDWSKASVAFHAVDCAGANHVAATVASTRARNVAAFASELPYDTVLETTALLEQERTGWFNFEWIVLNQQLSEFREAHDSAGVTWCPDFGRWPEDSQTCSTP